MQKALELRMRGDDVSGSLPRNRVEHVLDVQQEECPGRGVRRDESSEVRLDGMNDVANATRYVNAKLSIGEEERSKFMSKGGSNKLASNPSVGRANSNGPELLGVIRILVKGKEVVTGEPRLDVMGNGAIKKESKEGHES